MVPSYPFRIKVALAGVIAVIGLLLPPAGPGLAGTSCFGRAPTILGSNGADDELVGTPGDDVIHARGGRDWVYGRGGNDRICGGAGENFVFGEGGNDKLDASGGRVTGGPGNDLMKNSDVWFLSSPNGIVVDLADGTARGLGRDRLVNIRDVVGSKFEDKIRGDASENHFSGLAGADTLDGRGGQDYLSGETFHPDGEDKFYGGAGGDFLFGTRGDDRMDGEGGTDQIIFNMNAGGRVNLVTGRATGGGRGGNDRLFSIEEVIGSIYDDVLIGDD